MSLKLRCLDPRGSDQNPRERFESRNSVHTPEICENQNGTAGRGRQKHHDNLRHVTTLSDIIGQFPSLSHIDIKRHKMS